MTMAIFNFNFCKKITSNIILINDIFTVYIKRCKCFTLKVGYQKTNKFIKGHIIPFFENRNNGDAFSSFI